MNAVQIIKTAIAPTTLWMGIASVTGGMAAAIAHGNFELLPASTCLIFCVFVQIFSNLAHRYYDEKNGYGENRADGMTRCDDSSKPISYILMEGMKVSGTIAAMAGLAILAFAGWWALVIALLIAIFVALTNVGPYPMSRSVFYPVMTFIFFGPIAVIGTCTIQTAYSAKPFLSWWNLEPAVIMGIIFGLMAMNCHLIYGAYHRQSSNMTHRTSFMGRYVKHAYIVVMVTLTIVYGVVATVTPLLMDLRDKPWLYLPVPIISMIVNFVTVYYSVHKETAHKAWHISIINMLAVAVLTLIIMCIIGYPHSSMDAAPAIF